MMCNAFVSLEMDRLSATVERYRIWRSWQNLCSCIKTLDTWHHAVEQVSQTFNV